MPRRLTRPRSNSERGRAGRLRRADSIGKADAAWLARYDREVGAYAEARAARPKAPRGTPRARTNTERGKASRLRSKERDGKLSKAEQKFLDRYSGAVKKAKLTRDLKAARTRRRSVGGDARALAVALASWLGGAGDVTRHEGAKRSGGASVEVEVAPPAEDVPAGEPDLALHLSLGHAMSVRVELTVRGTKKTRWATILAYTDDAVSGSVDVWESLSEAFDGYLATGVGAVAVIVGPA